MLIIKAGILDSFQDNGRSGFGSLGISVGGCMDKNASTLATLLVGNRKDEAVLEVHFPGPVLYFPKAVVLAITGADFQPVISGVPIPLNRKFTVPSASTLQFTKKVWGQWAYIAVEGGWDIPEILGSKSTHLQAGFGGWKGRSLKNDDLIAELKQTNFQMDFPEISKWYPNRQMDYEINQLRVLPGPEWDWLPAEIQHRILNERFFISAQTNRMGYNLEGPEINLPAPRELISSPVLPGTVQLLPNGQMLVLMADAQTTGGYPRVLQVAAVDIPNLAQKGAGDSLKFELIEMNAAIELSKLQMEYLAGLQSSIFLMHNYAE